MKFPPNRKWFTLKREKPLTSADTLDLGKVHLDYFKSMDTITNEYIDALFKNWLKKLKESDPELHNEITKGVNDGRSTD